MNKMNQQDKIYFQVKDAILNSKSVEETKEKLNRIYTKEVIQEINRLNNQYKTVHE